MFFGRWKTDISKDGRDGPEGCSQPGVPQPWRRNRLMDDVRMMRPAEAADALGVSLARLAAAHAALGSGGPGSTA